VVQGFVASDANHCTTETLIWWKVVYIYIKFATTLISIMYTKLSTPFFVVIIRNVLSNDVRTLK